MTQFPRLAEVTSVLHQLHTWSQDWKRVITVMFIITARKKTNCTHRRTVLARATAVIVEQYFSNPHVRCIARAPGFTLEIGPGGGGGREGGPEGRCEGKSSFYVCILVVRRTQRQIEKKEETDPDSRPKVDGNATAKY